MTTIFEARVSFITVNDEIAHLKELEYSPSSLFRTIEAAKAKLQKLCDEACEVKTVLEFAEADFPAPTSESTTGWTWLAKAKLLAEDVEPLIFFFIYEHDVK